jgi:hypothetical protein
MANDLENTSPRRTLSEPHLPLARYELAFRARDRITLPPFQGALWRSVFGNALKGLTDRAEADGRNAEAGLYRYFFETPPPPGAAKMRLYEAAPHPYVIAAEPNFEPRLIAPGDAVLIELTLIGRGNDAAPSVFQAFAQAAAAGLGKSRGRAELSSVRPIWTDPSPEPPASAPPPAQLCLARAESPAIPPAPEFVEVHLVSPLRIIREKRLIGPADFGPADLLRALLRRVSMLMTFHTNCDLEADFRMLTALANGARMAEPSLSLATQRRWSTNKGVDIKMDGLMGGFVLDLRELSPLWPYLWLGQWVHAGKGAVMGLGAIHIREALDF